MTQTKQFLPDNSRPSYTGQGLTDKQKKFFKTPKTMKQIAEELFKGDYWAANDFQNKFLSNSVLKINRDATIELMIWE